MSTNQFFINEIIKILESELRNSFVKFGYGDSDMYKNIKVYAPRKKDYPIVISVPSYEIFIEYGTKHIKSKKIISSALRKARPQIDEVFANMWDDFIKRVGTRLFES